ncbi:2-oxo acid dehydrogenase subunit E2 [Kiritimatiellaeota bacterium B1221]|nr:2-oxo acid dehydrogenase subunit E2 [Kiritimatiellaeota bacterium B1221]
MNIEFKGKQALTSYRKIAIAAWRQPRDPSIYVILDLPAEKALQFLKNGAEENAMTLTHYVTKIIAHCLQQYPHLNHVLRRGNLYQRKEVDIFISTLIKTPKGNDLSGYVIRQADKKPIGEIAGIMKNRTRDLRNNQDENNRILQKVVNPTPSLFMRPLLWMQEFIEYSLNISIPKLGLAKDRFGSAMITNIGALGIENAFIPLSPYSRCPFIIGIGKVRKAPMVDGDRVVAGEMVSITFTADHRHVDGAHVSHMIRRFKKIFADPEKFPKVFN